MDEIAKRRKRALEAVWSVLQGQEQAITEELASLRTLDLSTAEAQRLVMFALDQLREIVRLRTILQRERVV